MRHRPLRARAWMAVGIIILIAGHGIILYYFGSHMALSAVVSGAIVLVVIKHLGVLGPVYALLRRRARHNVSVDDQENS
jgi:hypothetical protein